MKILFLGLGLLCSACATAPLSPPPPTHPASPAAAEASSSPPSALGPDAPTRRTEQLLTPP